MKTTIVLSRLILLASVSWAQEAETDTVVFDTSEVQPDTLITETELAFDPRLGDISDGSRAIPVHLIPMYDEMGVRLLPSDSPQLPFSTKQTCLPCHTYEIISAGWHFNANDTTVAPGRPGHPWILTDQATGTQLPLSHRDWEGVYDPALVGLTPFFFVQEFAHQFPGGGVGEDDSSDVDPETFLRWDVSGKLEVNCLACHDADPAHDQTEYTKQVNKENFRWAAPATAGFATVTGAAAKMQLSYNYFDGVGPGTWIDLPPRINYEDGTYNSQNNVFFNLTADVPDDNCYFCHTTVHKGTNGAEKWVRDEDVHLTSGMSCVDCHRNGIDHMIVRGYATEYKQPGKEDVYTLSCEGCHIGEHDEKYPEHGRLGAPVPKHTGIPTIHFEKMSCTSCHSGPWPSKQAQMVQTAIGHGLGNHGVVKADSVLPYILSPVFVHGYEGKIEPHNLMYPAFWASKSGDEITPLAPEDVKPFIETIIQADTLTDSTNQAIINVGKWPHFDNAKLITALDTLKSITGEAEPVYITGGQLFQLSEGQIVSQKHKVAEPYSWALAHNVRPAEQSTGVRGCKDCHSLGANFTFGKVDIPTMLTFAETPKKPMTFYQKTGGFYSGLFAFTFYFRPLLKLFIVICITILTAVLLLYVFKGLDAVVRAGTGESR